MAEEGNKPRVPSVLKKLVLDYQNTCIFMLKAWRRLMLLLAFALPAAFYLHEATLLQATINAVGFWFISAAISRFLVLEFRLLRARWVANKIESRIPAGHPSREAVIDWIRENNDGNYLNSLLGKLGVSPEASVADLPYDPTTLINGILLKMGKQEQQATHTYVYSSETQILDDETEPPEGFKPIPISVPKKKKKENKKRKRRRREYMPLDPETFDPEASEAGADGREQR